MPFSSVYSLLQMVQGLSPLNSFATQSRLLTTVKKKAFENTVGKGENAGNHSIFPQYFLPYQGEKSSFYQQLISRLQMLSIWSCRLGKG